MANFKDIIGQEQIKKHLQESIMQGSLSHAYIIMVKQVLEDVFLLPLSPKHFYAKTEHPTGMPVENVNPAFRQTPITILIFALLHMKRQVSVLMISVNSLSMIFRSSLTAVHIKYISFRMRTR